MENLIVGLGIVGIGCFILAVCPPISPVVALLVLIYLRLGDKS